MSPSTAPCPECGEPELVGELLPLGGVEVRCQACGHEGVIR